MGGSFFYWTSNSKLGEKEIFILSFFQKGEKKYIKFLRQTARRASGSEIILNCSKNLTKKYFFYIKVRIIFILRKKCTFFGITKLVLKDKNQ